MNESCSLDQKLLVILISEPLPVRLVGGNSSNEGLVEVYFKSPYTEEMVWGRICSDEWWDARDAAVICRQLGLPYRNAKADRRNVEEHRSEAEVWLDYVRCLPCSEMETNLGDCPYSYFWSTCQQEASVICAEGMVYYLFIHSNLISCPLIGSNTRSVLKMSTALRVLRPDCVRCFWCACIGFVLFRWKK